MALTSLDYSYAARWEPRPAILYNSNILISNPRNHASHSVELVPLEPIDESFEDGMLLLTICFSVRDLLNVRGWIVEYLFFSRWWHANKPIQPRIVRILEVRQDKETMWPYEKYRYVIVFSELRASSLTFAVLARCSLPGMQRSLTSSMEQTGNARWVKRTTKWCAI